MSPRVEPMQSVDAELRKQFIDALTPLLANGYPALEAMLNAAEGTLSTTGDPRALLTIAANLVADFELESRVRAARDPVAVGRVVEATLKAAFELQSVPDTVMNLPFLVADETGPKHFARALTRAEFDDLALRPVPVVDFLPSQPALDEAQLEEQREAQARSKKKRWWPF